MHIVETIALKDAVRCPSCGSSDVVYTCEPKCCFNHVCADCRTSFQLVTLKTERPPLHPVSAPEPASGDPAAACAACESLKLAVVSHDREHGSTTLACADCGAVLELAYQDIEEPA